MKIENIGLALVFFGVAISQWSDWSQRVEKNPLVLLFLIVFIIAVGLVANGLGLGNSSAVNNSKKPIPKNGRLNLKVT